MRAGEGGVVAEGVFFRVVAAQNGEIGGVAWEELKPKLAHLVRSLWAVSDALRRVVLVAGVGSAVVVGGAHVEAGAFGGGVVGW